MARNVLVDAGFVVALLSSRDAHHKRRLCNCAGTAEASSLVSESFAEVKTIAVFKPDDVFVPIIVRERLAEACIKGIVKPDIGANSDF